EPWFPFPSQDKWELAQWLMEYSSKPVQDQLILEAKSSIAPAYNNAHGFLKFIDVLPPGPKFSYTPLKVVGDTEDANGNNCIKTLELWHCDPAECIAELLGNPSFMANNSTHLSRYSGIKME
ncbi:hypothetical protein L208DRAFT_1263000, partial [Tricholoma matsutake]